MTDDLNNIRAYLANLDQQLSKLEAQRAALVVERDETLSLLAGLEEKLGHFAAAKKAPKAKKKLNNKEKVMQVLLAGSRAGLTTPQIKAAIKENFGEDILDTTLSSTLTWLSFHEHVKRQQKHWKFLRPL